MAPKKDGYVKNHTGGKKAAAPSHVSERKKQMQEVFSLFSRFDGNGDGTLELDELGMVMRSLDPGLWSDEKLSHLFQDMDVNSDGVIQYDEFLSWVFAIPKEECLQTSEQIDFKHTLSEDNIEPDLQKSKSEGSASKKASKPKHQHHTPHHLKGTHYGPQTKVQSGLHDVRHATDHIEAQVAEDETGLDVEQPPPGDGPLWAVLKDLEDTPEMLLEAQTKLSEAASAVVSSGGVTKHPTMLIAERTIPVIQRKIHLLLDVDRRISAVQQKMETRDNILARVLDNGEECPDELIGNRRFLSSYTHAGNPVDADKSDFEMFCQTFLLHVDHKMLQQLRDLTQELYEWWVAVCDREASHPGTYERLERLVNLAIAAGVDCSLGTMHRVKRMLLERLADMVFETAQARMQEAKEACEINEAHEDLIGKASDAARAIEQLILKAMQDGIPENDKRIEEARQVCKRLYELEAHRKRVLNRKKC